MANGWGARSSWKMCVERWGSGQRAWLGGSRCGSRGPPAAAALRQGRGAGPRLPGRHGERVPRPASAGDVLGRGRPPRIPDRLEPGRCSSASRDGMETPALAGWSARRPPLTRPARTADRQARVGTEGLQVEQRNRPGGWSPSHRPWQDRADGPSTPSGPADSLTRRRQITSYKNTTTSRATDTIAWD
jgi:hypothetical protein